MLRTATVKYDTDSDPGVGGQQICLRDQNKETGQTIA